MRIWNRNGWNGWNEYPRHITGGYGFCGGTIIASKFVLTAAHCVDKRDASGWYIRPYKEYEIAVRIGDHNIKLASDDHEGLEARFINVKRIIAHHDWDPSGVGQTQKGYDIALLELEEELDLSEYTPACLAKADSATKFDGKTAKAYGWGKTSQISWNLHPAEPYEVDLVVASKRQCKQGIGSILGIYKTIMCASVGRLEKSVCSVSTKYKSIQGKNKISTVVV